MQITTEDTGQWLAMRLVGRLDNDWAGHVNDAIDEALRQGKHVVVADLSGVSFLSSAGLGTLVRAHKRCAAIHGFFGVVASTPQVEEVVRLTGLAKMLLCDLEKVRQSLPSARSTIQPSFRMAAPAGMLLEIYDLNSRARLDCQSFGDPRILVSGEYSRQQCRRVEFPNNALGLGLGALGHDFADCEHSFGEFLAVGGGIALQPTRDAGKPDYQRSTGNFVPEVHALYGLACRGEFPLMCRFQPEESISSLRFSTLVDQCLEQTGANLAAMVFVAETAGLIGARLRQSPTSAPSGGEARFSHPEIRRWLSFMPERGFPHSLSLIVGIAQRGTPANVPPQLAGFLRPMAPNSNIHGHFHAAVFSYRPLKKRKVDLAETVASLYETEDLQAVIHLLHDDREIVGSGESEFVSGACWAGPIAQVLSSAGEDA